jgi:hypothetical protein
LKRSDKPPPPSFESQVGYSLIPKKTVQQRLYDAKEFLRVGKGEIEKGRSIADERMVREGCEKVFHSFVEAAAARIQKYGLGIPESHDDIRQGLYLARTQDLLDTWDRVFSRLHAISYYRGWLDYEKIDEAVKDVEKGIEKI